jgi:hypothetical protein
MLLGLILVQLLLWLLLPVASVLLGLELLRLVLLRQVLLRLVLLRLVLLHVLLLGLLQGLGQAAICSRLLLVVLLRLAL